MSVYLDHSSHALGRMRMCHMIADTPAELRAMALHLGLNLAWFQASASAPHFDISKGKRAAAIAAGAVVLERAPFVAKLREVKASWPVVSGKWARP